jgi:uncharacterized protein YqgC (DUF456 family)
MSVQLALAAAHGIFGHSEEWRGRDTMGEAGASKAPWHLWAIGGVSLLWNLGGAYDYVQTKRLDVDYLTMASDSVGITLADAIAYFEAFPVWMTIAWAIGVWGAVAGSALLLFKSRSAFYAFIASLVGVIIAGYYQYANPLPGAQDSTIANVFAVLVLVITVALIYYSRKMTKAGVLR